MSGRDPRDRAGAASSHAVSRVFGFGENPLTWSLPLAAFRGCAIRLHLVFVVFLAVRAVQSIQEERAGLVFQLGGLFGLLLLVAAHEAGHWLAARRVGVVHEQIVLWPLGGLSHGDEPARPTQLAAIAAAGPGVNVALLIPLACLTLLATRSWEIVLFNPFAYRTTAGIASSEGLTAWFIWSLHANNVMLLMFNLLPMHPLDSGRLLQAVLWARRGAAAAARTAGAIGLICAAVVAGIGLIANETVLLGIALIGAFVSWQELSRVRLLHGDEVPIDEDWPDDGGDAEVSFDEPSADPGEIDRILAKIGEMGLDSLTDSERASLHRASSEGHDSEVP